MMIPELVQDIKEVDEDWRPVLQRQRIVMLLDSLKAVCEKHNAAIWLESEDADVRYPTIGVELRGDNGTSFEELEITEHGTSAYWREMGEFLERGSEL
jgi:predicted deacylase